MTTRVLVTSDTHLELGARLPDGLLQLADQADHIIHAGDLTTLDVYDTMEALAPITAVQGNVDDMLTRLKLPARAEIDLAGVRIGVVHDPGPETGRRDRLLGWFPSCQLIVYGHTHMPEIGSAAESAPRIINPGSPTQRRRAPKHTVIWLELEAGAVLNVDLVELPE